MPDGLTAIPATRLDAHERECSRPRGAALLSGCRPGPRWFVVASYPKAERRAHAALHLKGFEAFLPTLTVRWVDRSWHTGPLFPGYLFCRLDLSKPWHPVTRCPGVFCLLSTDGIPTPCPDAVVEALRAGEAARSTPTARESLYRPGAACEAILAGGEPVDAVVIAVRNDRAVVAVMMFGHLREINVGLDSLRLRN